MTRGELRALDEALDFLNEGKVADKIKQLIEKIKKKNKRSQDNNKPTSKEISEFVTSKERKEFCKMVLREAKKVVPVINNDVGNPAEVFDLDDNEDFWEGVVYKGEEEQYQNNPNSNKFYRDRISVLYMDELRIKGNSDGQLVVGDKEMDQYYSNLTKAMNTLKSKLSQYGYFDSDGDKYEAWEDFVVKEGSIK